MNKYDDLDLLIREAIQDELESTPSPDLPPSQAWEQINRKLQEARKLNWRKKRPSRRKTLLYGVSVAAILFFAVLWQSPNSSALGKLTEIIHQIQGDFIQLLIRVDTPYENVDNLPPDTDYALIGQEIVSYETEDLAELKHHISFKPRLPKYMPQDLRFHSVSILKDKVNGSEEIIINYQGNDRTIYLNQRVVENALGSGLMMVDREDVSLQKVTVNGQPASLLTHKGGIRELIWVESSYHFFSIFGELSEEEIVAIAESM